MTGHLHAEANRPCAGRPAPRRTRPRVASAAQPAVLGAVAACILTLGACTPARSAAVDCAGLIRSAVAAGRVVRATPGEGATTAAGLESALQRARGLAAPRLVQLGAGDYFVQEPLRLGSRDSGTILAPAAPGAAVLHGGVDLGRVPWHPAGNGIFWAQLDPAALPHGIEALYVDGEAQTMARYPNVRPGDRHGGWLIAAPGTDGFTSLRFRPGSIPTGLHGPGLRIWITDASQWTSTIAGVAGIDRASGTIRLADNVPWHQLGEGSRFYLLGTRAALDAPGEWAYEAATGRLYFKPADPALLAGGHAISAGTADTLIDIARASDVAVCGLGLAQGTPHGSDRGEPYYRTGGGAIRAVDTDGLLVDGNRIRDVGVGINLLGARAAVIRDNEIDRVAGNGINIGAGPDGVPSRGLRVTRNDIGDVGRVFVESAGIWFNGTVGSLFAGNTVRHAAQFGIYGGQIKDVGVDAIRDNVISDNVIRDVNEASADGGGIKLYAATAGGSTGNSITGNWVDGVTQLMSRPDGTFFAADDWSMDRWPQPIAAGIYLDWNSQGTLIADNVVTRSWGGVLIVNSSGTTVRHNLVKGGTGPAFEITRQPDPARTPMRDNDFSHNVVMRDGAHATAVKIYDATGGPLPASFAGDVYWGAAVDGRGFDVRRGDGSPGLSVGVEGWNGSGFARDEHRLDPGLVDPAAGDFRLAPASPLPRLGIEPLPAALLDRVRARARQEAAVPAATALTWMLP